jgi:PhnB protein
MSKPSFKPESYTSVSPYLVVTNAAATIQFLIDVFNAAEIRRIPEPSTGRIMHAEVRLDDSIIMLGDCIQGMWPAVAAHVHVYVPDVDAIYARALKHGATAVQEPVKKGDEDKRGGFKDSGGTTWWVGTKVE